MKQDPAGQAMAINEKEVKDMKIRTYRWSAFILIFIYMMSLCACGVLQIQPEQTQPRKAVIMPRQNYEEPPYVDYSLTDLPEFVQSIEACTDSEKQYVLPDGYVYRMGEIFVPSATNQLYLATDQDNSLFNGCGYQNNARIRSTLEIGECDFSFITGYIPVKPGDTVYFSGNCFDPANSNAGVMNISFHNAEKKTVAQEAMVNVTGNLFEVLETNDEGYVTALRVRKEAVPEDLAYIRFTLLGSGYQQIISVNESLEQGSIGYGWVQQEKYISESWYQEIADTVETVKSIALPEEPVTTAFLFASDIHLDPGSTSSYTENLGKVSAEVMRACGIPFFATGGDNSTQSSGFMPSDFSQNMIDVLGQLDPIPQKNILLAVGNHDGATGAKEENGEILYYRYQLNNQERSDVFFGWQRETNAYKRFDSDGTYYYLDDAATKTRYIILNSFWSQWEGDENGYVSDPVHGFMQTPIFGPQQLTWFASEALDMPPGYGAVIFTHNAQTAKDFAVFKELVDAYSGHTVYDGSYTGTEEWQSTEIAVNYRYAEGEILAVFQGHNHADSQPDLFETVPCIEISTAGAHWAVKDTYEAPRKKGTASEFAVDVVLIDRVNRMIYLTRLGVGLDRAIPY